MTLVVLEDHPSIANFFNCDIATSANSSSVKWVSQLTVQLTEIGATRPK